MTKIQKLLAFIGFEIVIDIEPHFENQRIVQRGKKQVLQKFIEGNYAMDDHWEDVKKVKFREKG